MTMHELHDRFSTAQTQRQPYLKNASRTMELIVQD